MAGFWRPPPGGARGKCPPLPPLATPLVNSTVNFDIVCTATAIKELCQARDMGDTQFFNRQELTIMIKTLCINYCFNMDLESAINVYTYVNNNISIF